MVLVDMGPTVAACLKLTEKTRSLWPMTGDGREGGRGGERVLGLAVLKSPPKVHVHCMWSPGPHFGC